MKFARRLMWVALVWAWHAAPSARAADPAPASHVMVILEVEGTVEVLRAGSVAWDKANKEAPYNKLGPGDQLRTGENSRAAVRLSNGTVTRLDQKSLLRIPEQKKESTFFEFVRGIMYFFHRDKPGELDVNTPRVSAVIRGTEFNLAVAEDGTTTLTLFDGQVEMTNSFGRLAL